MTKGDRRFIWCNTVSIMSHRGATTRDAAAFPEARQELLEEGGLNQEPTGLRGGFGPFLRGYPCGPWDLWGMVAGG